MQAHCSGFEARERFSEEAETLIRLPGLVSDPSA
jgi:hypothetical protein